MKKYIRTKKGMKIKDKDYNMIFKGNVTLKNTDFIMED